MKVSMTERTLFNLVCFIDNIKFNIDIMTLENKSTLLYLRFKKIQGDSNGFNRISAEIVQFFKKNIIFYL